MGKFHQILSVSGGDTSIFSFPDDNDKYMYQWIFAKLRLCIDIEEIWFLMLTGKFCQCLTELSARDTSVFSFQDNNLSNSQRIFTKLDMCIDIVEICFGIAIVHIHFINFDRVISP